MANRNFSRLKKNRSILIALCKASDKHKKMIIKNASMDLFKTLCDICYNILKGNIPMSRKQRLELLLNKKIIRKMGRKSLGLKTKRRHLIQHGGAIGALIPAIGLVTALISNLF
jgi:hypothetical protein